jgi:hypothetical protein
MDIASNFEYYHTFLKLAYAISMLSVCLYIPPINFCMPEPIFMKLSICNMASEFISTAYFVNPSHLSVSVCVSLLSLLGNCSVECIPPFGARQRLGKHIPAQ